MRIHLLVIVLGIYIFAMGVLGMARTASLTPVYISGAISAITIWIGWLLGKGLRPVRNVALIWLSLNTAVLAYMTFGQIPAHADSDKSSMIIFGSMAVFALVTLLLAWRAYSRRGHRGDLR